MDEGAADTETVAYVQYVELQKPDLEAISAANVERGFQSKEWRRNFETLTQLRQANRYYSNVFLQELLPKNSEHIIQQIDNLRSNNSKQALTLASEILEHQSIDQVDPAVLRPLVSALFIKSTSEKGFIKSQALKAVNILPKKYNPCLIEEIGTHTQSNNGNIAELAAKVLVEYVEENKISELGPGLMTTVAKINSGKRALLQKKGRELIVYFKKLKGEQAVIEVARANLDNSLISEEEFNAILREVKRQQKAEKPQGNFRDFLKSKKSGKE